MKIKSLTDFYCINKVFCTFTLTYVLQGQFISDSRWSLQNQKITVEVVNLLAYFCHILPKLEKIDSWCCPQGNLLHLQFTVADLEIRHGKPRTLPISFLPCGNNDNGRPASLWVLYSCHHVSQSNDRTKHSVEIFNMAFNLDYNDMLHQTNVKNWKSELDLHDCFKSKHLKKTLSICTFNGAVA